MIIIAITDLHGNLDHLPAVSDDLGKADIVLIAGDITHFGNAKQAEQIITSIREYLAPEAKILAIPGNCDQPGANGVDEYLESAGISLHCKCLDLDDVTLIGIGSSLPCPGRTPNESPEEVFQSVLNELKTKVTPGKTTILLSHQPGYGTLLDMIGNDTHTGSKAIRKFIETVQPTLAVSGHMHEAVGIDHIGPTTLVNPGPFRQGRYAYIKLSEKVDNIEIRTC